MIRMFDTLEFPETHELLLLVTETYFFFSGNEMNTIGKFWLENASWRYFCHGMRHLYSSSSLGIDSFISHKKKVIESNPDISVIKERLRQICDTNSRSLVLLYDLHNMVRVAETEEDLKLLLALLKKFNRQTQFIEKDVKLLQMGFGPRIMRVLYVMNKPKEAVALIEDDNFFQYFKNFTSILLLLHMLFKNKMYEEVIKCYEYYNGRTDTYNSFDLYFIFLAACFKLNTPDSFEKALQVYMLHAKKKIIIPLRGALFFAALAINQNQPYCAINTLAKFNFHSVVENFKLMAYAKAKRFDYVLEVATDILGWAGKKNIFITNEALCFVEKELQNYNDVLQFQQLKEKLAAQNLITDEALDKFLFQEVNLKGKKISETRGHII